MARKDQSQLSVRLRFAAAPDPSWPGLGADSYLIRMLGEGDEEVLRLSLDAKIVELAVLKSLQPNFCMAPDGTISPGFDVHYGKTLQCEEVPLDVLVEQSLDPKMLEDEPTARSMILTLRERLMRALRIADETLQRLK